MKAFKVLLINTRLKSRDIIPISERRSICIRKLKTEETIDPKTFEIYREVLRVE